MFGERRERSEPTQGRRGMRPPAIERAMQGCLVRVALACGCQVRSQPALDDGRSLDGRVAVWRDTVPAMVRTHENTSGALHASVVMVAKEKSDAWRAAELTLGADTHPWGYSIRGSFGVEPVSIRLAVQLDLLARAIKLAHPRVFPERDPDRSISICVHGRSHGRCGECSTAMSGWGLALEDGRNPGEYVRAWPHMDKPIITVARRDDRTELLVEAPRRSGSVPIHLEWGRGASDAPAS